MRYLHNGILKRMPSLANTERNQSKSLWRIEDTTEIVLRRKKRRFC